MIFKFYYTVIVHRDKTKPFAATILDILTSFSFEFPFCLSPKDNFREHYNERRLIWVIGTCLAYLIITVI